MHPPFVALRPRFASPYMLGLITAPFAAAVIKPLLRSSVKAAVGIGLQVRKLAEEAREEFQDVAAEVSAEMAAAEAQRSGTTAPETRRS